MKMLTASLTLALLAGCVDAQTLRRATPPATSTPTPTRTRPLPDLGAGRRIVPGVLVYEVRLPGKQVADKLWIYLPEQPATAKLPCVLIAPAGSRPFHGKSLGEGDRAEHLPYVREGFAVVAYEISGDLADEAGDVETRAAMNQFRLAEAGVADARAALDYAAAKVGQIDTTRVFATGHSSAATLALLVLAREPRVRAGVAFAPATDVPDFIGDRGVAALSALVPGFGEFLVRSSPRRNVAALTRPLLLFHAADDSVVPFAASVGFAAEVSKTNTGVEFVRAATGDHYDAMIEQGIPRAIRWLKNSK